MVRRQFLKGFASLMALSLLAGCNQQTTPPPTNTKTLILADISGSMYSDIKTYRNLLFDTVDTIGNTKTEIEIFAFLNENKPEAMELIYKGKPEDSEDIYDTVRKNIYPDTPGKKTQNNYGTSFTALLKYVREESAHQPVRVCIISDGGICAAMPSTADGISPEDQKLIDAAKIVADSLAQEKNFKGIVILPVQPGLGYTQLEQQVFKKLKTKKPVTIATQENAPDALETLRKM